ncbi:hypothetical protein WN51_13630 [Melipona quadrifasciata]|uniref:Uncharacterized protein n=1 Tax=Melipona quadrifasciata TaxID=166423 RepID=A0A0N0BGN8_9HYME|nr:hypothetical protein WN51_13630 [Melipona quadrifasciata]
MNNLAKSKQIGLVNPTKKGETGQRIQMTHARGPAGEDAPLSRAGVTEYGRNMYKIKRRGMKYFVPKPTTPKTVMRNGTWATDEWRWSVHCKATFIEKYVTIVLIGKIFITHFENLSMTSNEAMVLTCWLTEWTSNQEMVILNIILNVFKTEKILQFWGISPTLRKFLLIAGPSFYNSRRQLFSRESSSTGDRCNDDDDDDDDDGGGGGGGDDDDPGPETKAGRRSLGITDEKKTKGKPTCRLSRRSEGPTGTSTGIWKSFGVSGRGREEKERKKKERDVEFRKRRKGMGMAGWQGWHVPARQNGRAKPIFKITKRPRFRKNSH